MLFCYARGYGLRHTSREGMTLGEAQLRGIELDSTIARAIELVSEALELLDGSMAPADIGAHLDLALHRMRREPII